MAGLDPAISALGHSAAQRPPDPRVTSGDDVGGDDLDPELTWKVARLYTTKAYPMAVGMRVCQSVSRW